MRSRKDLPLEDTVSTKEFIDGNRARVLYARGEIKPLRVSYPDGSRAEFAYDASNKLVQVSDRSGTLWMRSSEPDRRGFSKWQSSDGQTCLAKFVVLPDGTYQRQDPTGVIETVTTGQKRFVARAFPANFSAVGMLKAIFQEIDRNRDTTLTRLELENALKTHGSKHDHLSLIAMLRHYFDEIIKTRDDPMLIEAGGLTVADVERFEKIKAVEQKRLCEAPPFLVAMFEELFSLIDSDQDGMTNLAEITLTCRSLCPTAPVPTDALDSFRAARSNLTKDEAFRAQLAEFGVSFSEEEAAIAASMVQSDEKNAAESSDITKSVEVYSAAGVVLMFLEQQDAPQSLAKFDIHSETDWIYKKSFISICERACAFQAENRMLKGGWFYDEQRSVSSIPKNIFADSAAPAESIRVEAVRHGTLSDSIFLATLAGAVNTNPPAIIRCLRQVPSKTCTVTFPGALETPITMAWLTALELSLYQHNTTYGIWCAFVQKAYEVYLHTNNIERSVVPRTPDAAMHLTNLPYFLLTGKKAGWRLFKHTHPEEVISVLSENLRLRLPTLVCTNPVESWIRGVNILPGHVLALTRFDSETRQITLRDPLASAVDKSPGAKPGDASAITLSLDELFANFLAMSIITL